MLSKIIIEGGPGTGKSTFLNTLIDGNPYSKRFKAQNAPDKSNVTLQVQIETNNIFNDNNYMKCQGIDIPGLCDGNISISDIINQLVVRLNGEKINAGVILVKSTDNRLTFAQISSMKILANFFQQVKPQSIWLGITHIDLLDVDQNFINAKINAFQKYGLTISPENVIKFNINNSKQSLQKFVQKLSTQNQQDQMQFIDKGKINSAIEDFQKSVPLLTQQMKQINSQLEEEQRQANLLKQQMEAAKLQQQQLQQSINQVPPQQIIYHSSGGGGGGCQIF